MLYNVEYELNRKAPYRKISIIKKRDRKKYNEASN